MKLYVYLREAPSLPPPGSSSTRRRTIQASTIPVDVDDDTGSELQESRTDNVQHVRKGVDGSVNGSANGLTNGAVNGIITKTTQPGRAKGSEQDPRVDSSGRFEFGGPWGVAAMMIGFPPLMWYMWIGATYYDGHLPIPVSGQGLTDFLSQLIHLVYEGAYPSAKAWIIYWGFIVFEAVCYMYLPGVWTIGKPLDHEGGKQLRYYCSGVWSFYTTIVVVALLHLTGWFPLYTVLDEFGPLLSVAIISGFLVSVVAYWSALHRGAQHRMSGYPIYDFFMGAELNPRLFDILDLKMFSEVRIPWYTLFLISAAAATRQYEQFGYVSGEMGFVLMAHFLYANAPSKGEEFIPPTW